MKKITTCEPPVQLWIDEPDAPERVAVMQAKGTITPQEAEQLLTFMQKGYVILPKAFSDEQIDAFRDEMAHMHEEKEKYLMRLNKGGVAQPEDALLPYKSRMLDNYVPSEKARDMVLADAITRFLQLVYEEPPLAFQSLLFTWGSEQSMHKDTAFVVVEPRCTLTASWIALEDIEPGQGELVYYPGSHKHPLFVFGEGSLSWNVKRDGKFIHGEYTQFLHNQATQYRIAVEHFAAKKGDVLIWHPNLSHGGADVTDKDSTRLSLVTHYCPYSANPKYFTHFELAHKQAWKGGYYSSRRYDVQQCVADPQHIEPVFFG